MWGCGQLLAADNPPALQGGPNAQARLLPAAGALVFRFQTAGLCRGVCIQYRSLYPKEVGYLFPPLAFLALSLSLSLSFARSLALSVCLSFSLSEREMRHTTLSLSLSLRISLSEKEEEEEEVLLTAYNK